MNVAGRFAALSAALFLGLPCTAAAQEDPETVYGKFHRALHAGNMDELRKYGTAEGMKELDSIPADQRAGVLELIRKLVPPTYTVTSKEPSPDGNRLTIRATAMGNSLFGEKPEPVNGTIQMVKMGGAWKVKETSWQPGSAGAPPSATGTPTAPRAASPGAPQSRPAPLKATTPKSPPPVVGAAKQPCVYKPVMTNEDMERCR